MKMAEPFLNITETYEMGMEETRTDCAFFSSLGRLRDRGIADDHKASIAPEYTRVHGQD